MEGSQNGARGRGAVQLAVGGRRLESERAPSLRPPMAEVTVLDHCFETSLAIHKPVKYLVSFKKRMQRQNWTKVIRGVPTLRQERGKRKKHYFLLSFPNPLPTIRAVGNRGTSSFRLLVQMPFKLEMRLDKRHSSADRELDTTIGTRPLNPQNSHKGLAPLSPTPFSFYILLWLILRRFKDSKTN